MRRRKNRHSLGHLSIYSDEEFPTGEILNFDDQEKEFFAPISTPPTQKRKRGNPSRTKGRPVSVAVSNLREVWDLFELDASGSVDFVGFRLGLEQFGVNLTVANARDVFRELDVNNDGQINQEEFYKLVKSDIRNLSKLMISVRKELEKSVLIGMFRPRSPGSPEFEPEGDFSAILELETESSQSEEETSDFDDNTGGLSFDDDDFLDTGMLKKTFSDLDYFNNNLLGYFEFIVACTKLGFKDLQDARRTFEKQTYNSFGLIDYEDFEQLIYFLKGEKELKDKKWKQISERVKKRVFEDVSFNKKYLTKNEACVAGERLGVHQHNIQDKYESYCSLPKQMTFLDFSRILNVLHDARCHPLRRIQVPINSHYAPQDEVDYTFERVDWNNKGKIKENEFIVACKWLGLRDVGALRSDFKYRASEGELTKNNFNESVNNAWINHKIQIKELSKNVSNQKNKSLRKDLQDALSHLDLENTGFVSFNECAIIAERLQLNPNSQTYNEPIARAQLDMIFNNFDLTACGWIPESLLLPLFTAFEKAISLPLFTRPFSRSKYDSNSPSLQQLNTPRSGSGRFFSKAEIVKTPDFNLPAARKRNVSYEHSPGRHSENASIAGSRSSVVFEKMRSLLTPHMSASKKDEPSPLVLGFGSSSLNGLEKKNTRQLLGEQVDRLQERNDNLERDLEKIKNSFKEKDTLVDALRSEIKHLKMRSKSQIESFEEDLGNIETEQDSKLLLLSDQLLSQETVLEERDVEIRKLRKTLKEKEQTHAETEAQLEKLKVETFAELQKVEEEFEELEHENDTLVEQKRIFHQHSQELEVRNQTLEDDLAAHSIKSRKLKKKLKSLGKKYKSEVRSLTQRKEKMESKSEKRNDALLNETIRYMRDEAIYVEQLKKKWKTKKEMYRIQIKQLKLENKQLEKRQGTRTKNDPSLMPHGSEKSSTYIDEYVSLMKEFPNMFNTLTSNRPRRLTAVSNVEM